VSKTQFYSSFDNDTNSPIWPLLGRLQRAARFAVYSLIAWFDRISLSTRKPSIIRHVTGSGHDPAAETLCIFAHYDKQDRVDDYVLYTLQKLKELGADIIFVSTATTLGDECIAKISPYCAQIMVRENRGYDFGSWKLGIECADNLPAYQRLILANDSVYGPLHDLHNLILDMRQRGAAVWGITDSYQLEHHLQSYFLVFEREALDNPAFGEFWQNLPTYRFKRSIIRDGEIGLSAKLSRAGLCVGAVYGYDSLRKNYPEMVIEAERKSIFAAPVNPTRSLWDLLVSDCGCPFLKVDVLRDNPESSPVVKEWPQILGGVSNYDTRLIERHLARMHVRS
jgi:lipopolysaccharide biosynthesis protein